VNPQRDVKSVLVTGGAGYVGAVLVPRLLREGYRVNVVDLFAFGDDVFGDAREHASLVQLAGDIRDQDLLRRAAEGMDAVIHLACISNDPSVELDPQLSRRINYDAFGPLVDICREAGARRFIFASSSSVYGVSDEPDVTEDHPLVPLTAYNRYKAECEPILLERQAADFTTVVIRPATLCGVSPRQRLDLTVNILTSHAVNKGKITVFGGTQQRPNLHIDDMVDLYVMLLKIPSEKIAGKIFNAGYQNHSVAEIAEIVKRVVEQEMPERAPIEIETTPSDDLRSYRICSDKIRRELGFEPKRTLEDAVRDLVAAFRAGRIPNAMTDDRYYNVKVMKRLNLT
jgi:nucleoside-diphosphate-sugar epimerase